MPGACQPCPSMRCRPCAVSRLEGTLDPRLRAANDNFRESAMTGGAMQFGIFDQNDHGPYPLSEQYENRLQLIEF